MRRSFFGFGLATLLVLDLLAQGAGHAICAAADQESGRRGLRPGHPIVVAGEVVELAGYLREGRHGAEAKAEMITAMKGGAPLAVLEEVTGTLFLLAAETPATHPNDVARDYVADQVRIHGTMYERASTKLLVIDRIERVLP